MGAMDFTLSAAARSHDPRSLSAHTVEMSTNFYVPARSTLLIEGLCLRHGRSLAFCDAKATDESGVLIAVARGIFKVVSSELSTVEQAVDECTEGRT